MTEIEQSQNNTPVIQFPTPDDSHILTFDLERPNLRGRVLRMGRVLDDILSPHNFPEPIEKLLVETMCISSLLSSMLKYEGIFILQTQSNGVVSRLVSDMTSQGELRASAGFDKTAIENFLNKHTQPTMFDLLGEGYLAFTVDQGEFTERYQGIVELKEDLLSSIHHYFSQSEQIGTAIKLAKKKTEDGKWKASAIMLQHTPDHTNIPQDDKPVAENWNRAQILLETCSEEELLDSRLHDETLLYRLFHEEGVRVYKPLGITKGCRCFQEKLKTIMNLLSADDIDHAITDGKLTMTCEFCNKDFCFSKDDL